MASLRCWSCCRIHCLISSQQSLNGVDAQSSFASECSSQKCRLKFLYMMSLQSRSLVVCVMSWFRSTCRRCRWSLEEGNRQFREGHSVRFRRRTTLAYPQCRNIPKVCCLFIDKYNAPTCAIARFETAVFLPTKTLTQVILGCRPAPWRVIKFRMHVPIDPFPKAARA